MKDRLSELKEAYERGENIISYLKEIKKTDINTSEIIQASYDLQAGTYSKLYYKNPQKKNEYCKRLASEIDELGYVDSLLLVGCGEAITLTLLLKYLKRAPKYIYGIDISLSRLLYALKFSKEQNVENIELAVADLFQLPFLTNSIELVLTNHSLEPNGGKEKEALKELYRVSKKYIWMNEPSVKFGDKESRKRIITHGYVQDLDKHAHELGYNVIINKPFPISMNDKNPTGTTLIKKVNLDYSCIEDHYACPITKKKLSLFKDSYYSGNGYLLYPTVAGIPIFLKNSSIISFHIL